MNYPITANNRPVIRCTQAHDSSSAAPRPLSPATARTRPQSRIAGEESRTFRHRLDIVEGGHARRFEAGEPRSLVRQRPHHRMQERYRDATGERGEPSHDGCRIHHERYDVNAADRIESRGTLVDRTLEREAESVLARVGQPVEWIGDRGLGR